jgi:hypothetical protein
MSFEHAIAIAGVVVSVASVVASFVNQYVRDAQQSGSSVSAWVLHSAAVLNALALNGDKAVQALKLAKAWKAS